jgi:ferrous iron transport protein B
MKLSELKNGERGRISKVLGHGAFRKRIMEMGFIRGKEVLVIKNAPLNDPIEYQIMGYEISLRRSEANLIEVDNNNTPYVNSVHYESDVRFLEKNNFGNLSRKTINVALVGNPNAGKTTLFNYASGSKEHVGNYSGVTVESKKARMYIDGYTINIFDLPGTYSLTAFSPEELYVRKFITEDIPDVVINVLDASNLERNLFLTTQLIDMDIRVIAALNMYDELQKSGSRFNYFEFGKMVGIPFVPVVSSKGNGIKELFRKVIDVFEDREPIIRHVHINYGKTVENAIKSIQNAIKRDIKLADTFSPRFLALKLLEEDTRAEVFVKESSENQAIISEVNNNIPIIEKQYNEKVETIITDARYGFISGALRETYVESPLKQHRNTEIIDTLITHKLFGFPIFFFFMFVMFYSTFTLGKYPQSWIELLIIELNNLISGLMTEGELKDLILNGIIAGVGGVIIFLPNILILFLFISFMEDTGYMARAAFIMDKMMHRIGLHGKSFIPLIMGFGCNVPAIMATRTIENKNDRLITMLINPFMSCSARLPVYILIIGAFFPDNPTLILFILYIIGILIAVLAAKLFKKYFFKNAEAPFVMELPPYRMPSLKSAFQHTWEKGFQYLKKMGGVILVASICIWALGYYPRNTSKLESLKMKQERILANSNQQNPSKQQSNYNTISTNLKTDSAHVIRMLEIDAQSELQENSYIGRIGKFIEPIMSPLGFDWRMGVSLLTGISAKEIVVSTMGVLFQSNTLNEDNQPLSKRLQNAVYTSGSKKGSIVFTSLSALSYLLFILIYFPCIAVIATIRKESESWKWALFTVFYTTGLAWLVSFIFYQTGKLFF